MSARESIGRQVCVSMRLGRGLGGGKGEGGSVKGRRTGTVSQTLAFLHELSFKTLYHCGDWFSLWQLVNLGFSNNKTRVLSVQWGRPPKTKGCFPKDLVWEQSPSRAWEEGSPKALSLILAFWWLLISNRPFSQQQGFVLDFKSETAKALRVWLLRVSLNLSNSVGFSL